MRNPRLLGREALVGLVALAASLSVGIGTTQPVPRPVTVIRPGLAQLLVHEDRLISIHPYNPNSNKDVLARAFEGNVLAYRDALAAFGPPSDIYMGAGAQSGGFGVNGYADAGSSAPAGPTGTGQPSTSQAGQTGQGVQPVQTIIGKTGAPLAGVNPGDAGLVTWIYNNFYAVGNTLSITFDEFADGAVTIIRYYGSNLRSPVGTLRGDIRLGASFGQVLARYGYPDLTSTQSFDETAVYYFGSNVIFGFQGSGPNMRVDSITINPGLMPEPLPPGTQGTHTHEVMQTSP